jgi:hypothetical protein
VVVFLVLCAALTAPFLDVPLSDLTAGSRAYLGSWENNSSIFAILRATFGRAAAGAISGLTVAALVVWLTFRRGDILVHVPVVLAAPLLLGPTFFPWYISWVLPFGCLFPNVTMPVATYLLLAPYLFVIGDDVGFAARVPSLALIYATGIGEWLTRRRSSSSPASPSDSP